MAEAAALGTKTQHRLHLTAQTALVDGRYAPKLFAALIWDSHVYVDPGPSPTGNAGPYLHVAHKNGDSVHRVYPALHLGDLFWVQEPWFPIGAALGKAPKALAIPGACQRSMIRFQGRGDKTKCGRLWRSPYSLPRNLVRTELKIVRVGAERVDAVAELDARAEGYPCDLHLQGIDGAPCGCLVSAYRFREAWRIRYGAEAASAWCWSYTVERKGLR
jgi:hypothetical protein